MQKIKSYRSADCVVGGFRYNEGTRLVGSLLLGLYDDRGLLDHVGFTSTIKHQDKPALTKKLKALIGGPGFTGDAPGGPSRLVDQALRRMDSAQAEARRRGLLRPIYRKSLPPRHEAAAVASGQSPKTVPPRPARSEEA
jgi:ATP-dependent DNA ligase